MISNNSYADTVRNRAMKLKSRVSGTALRVRNAVPELLHGLEMEVAYALSK